MLTAEEVQEAHRLFRAGYSIAAVSRHLGRDRSTIRAYLKGTRAVRRGAAPADALAPYLAYCRARLAASPHLPAAALYADVVAQGYPRSYSSFTRVLRVLGLRPACATCGGTGLGHGSGGRGVTRKHAPAGESR